MKCLLLFVPLIALVGVSCSTTTNSPVSNSLAPTITGFSPDTVWTFRTLTIYGTNFGYDYQDIRVFIDTTQVWSNITHLDDTVMTVLVPEEARTGFIRVRAYEQTSTSSRPVVIEYTFSPHYVTDTAYDGGSFSIPGTGMNHSHGVLRLFVGGISFPIDSVFADRIVSHVPPNSPSGTMTITDSDGTYNPGTLIVTRPSSWKTLSEIWDNLTMTETHQRTGYTNGPAHTIDSIWRTTVSYAGQRDTNIAGIPFERTGRGLQYSAGPVQIGWDTISQTATVSFVKFSYAPTTSTHSLDTEWYVSSQTLPAPLPVDNDIEFVLPNYYYRITEDSTDGQGLVNWQETTTATVTSGEFDIILKH